MCIVVLTCLLHQYEAYIRRHERLGSDRLADSSLKYASYLCPLRGHESHLLELISTFTSKDDK